MTFSVVARCARTGMFGVAVSSSSPAVAARCAYAQAGVGAIASQNVTDPTLGMRGLELMARGASAAETVAILKRTGTHIEYRQVLAVDAAGVSAIHSGPKALGTWAEARAESMVMAAEKYAAACMLTARLVTGGLGRTPGEVAHATLRFHRHWVRANRRRLARGEGT